MRHNIRQFRKLFLIISIFLFAFFVFTETFEESYPQKELRISISNGIPCLHPHVSFSADEAQMLTALYEGLFTYDPYTLKPIPGLVEKWSVTGGRTWKFKIKKNTRFETGEKITAQTIADSWFNLLTPNANYQYASLLDCIDGAQDYRKGILKDKNQVGIKVESETELLVYTNTPSVHLPSILCHHAFSAVNKTQLKDADFFSNIGEIKNSKKAFKPISSGAYKIEKFTDNEIILIKNENYWDKNSVNIPKITIFLNLDKDAAAEKFNKGEIDWLSRTDVLNKIGEQRYVNFDPMFSTEFFFFKPTSQYVKNKELRQALLLAIPYEKLRKGYLIKATTLVFPLAGYPNLEGVEEFNIYKAKNIIKDLKLKPEEKKIIIRIPEGEYYENLAEILKTAWSEIDITCKIEALKFSQYYDNLKTNDYNLGIISWIGDFADPLAFLEMFRKNSTLNDSGWSNEEFENKIKKAGGEKDIKKRYKILGEAEDILLKNAVIIPLSHNSSINILDTFALDGWYPNAIDIHPFKFMKFVKPKPLPGVVKK